MARTIAWVKISACTPTHRRLASIIAIMWERSGHGCRMATSSCRFPMGTSRSRFFFADLMGLSPEHSDEETSAVHAAAESFFAELMRQPVPRPTLHPAARPLLPAPAEQLPSPPTEDPDLAEDVGDSNLESDGRSADSALTWHFDEPALDPEASNDKSRELSQVWISSDNLRRIPGTKGFPPTTSVCS